MCGRFTLKTDPKVIASQFQVSSIAILEGRIADLTSQAKKLDQIESDPFLPNFNVAPTHQIPAIVSQNADISSDRINDSDIEIAIIVHIT